MNKLGVLEGILFVVGDEGITLGQLCEVMEIEESEAKEILLDVDNNELFYDNSREICDIWKEVLPCMWW